MEQSNSEMFNEIITAAIEIAESHGLYITNEKAAEYLISTVGSHASNRRRQSEFFNSMMSEKKEC